MDDLRRDLFATIDACPWLDFQLLTKRPGNVRRMWPIDSFLTSESGLQAATRRRSNVHLYTSVSDQATADAMSPRLLACRDLVPVLGLSAEPLLGPVDLSAIKAAKDVDCNALTGVYRQWCDAGVDHPGAEQFHDGGPKIDHVIVGGESGPGARPMHPQWARDLRDQCQAAGVPFFFKQWGEWAPAFHSWSCQADGETVAAELAALKRKHQLAFAGNESPDDLWQYRDDIMVRVGKKAAGRDLDGREWNEMPEVNHA
jgi:protein gp37